MTAVVRVFFHEGLVTVPVAAGTRYATDSVGALKQPYMSGSLVVARPEVATSSDVAPAKAQVAYVQVQHGKTVHFEVNPPNRLLPASSVSPVMAGDQTFVIGPGWSFSFLEV